MAAATTTATRIYVGGLGERVKEEDLRNTFSSLGSVESVDIIRTKGRSFAYINFLPSSHNSLPKLFSMYNGCSWKGGKLKLEKAKEHYMDRLKREWAEDAELTDAAQIDHVNVDENMVASAEPKSPLDYEKMQIRIFFPKLRKVKSLPFRGSGKHKYSFQRVEPTSRPIHFCDCPEHSDPVITPKAKHAHKSNIQNVGVNEKQNNVMNSTMNRFSDGETKVHDSEIIQDGGMNEEEINVMNSVMKKLLERDTSSKPEPKELKDAPQQTIPTSDFQVEANEVDDRTDDDDDDDDDITINMVSGQNNRSFSPESWDLQRSFVNKMGRSDEQLNKPENHQNRMVKPSNKKRKSLPEESNERDQVSPIGKKKARLQPKLYESEDHLENLKNESENQSKTTSTKGKWKELISDDINSSFSLSHIITQGEQSNNEECPKPSKQTSSKKSEEHFKNLKNVTETQAKKTSTKGKWKELVGDDISSSFSLSHITQGGQSNSNEECPKPGNQTSSDSKDHKRVNNIEHENSDGQSSESNDREGQPAAQPSKPSNGTSDNSGRGNSWLQKSTWTQLIGGGNSSSFSISQILPADMLEKQEAHKPNDFSTTSTTTVFGGSRGLKSSSAVSNKKKDAKVSALKDSGISKAPSRNNPSDSSVGKKSELKPKRGPSSFTGVGDSCPFMRSDDSMKDWMTAKTALSGALKKGQKKKQ